MKRVFGKVEAGFDIIYLSSAFIIAFILFLSGKITQGFAALILVVGDSFHLLPRIQVILGKEEVLMRKSLGIGKLIASITMTCFYLLLWQLGAGHTSAATSMMYSNIFYILAAIRILLCLLPQNQWTQRYPPVKWGIYRNIPFFLMGIFVIIRYSLLGNTVPQFQLMWLAVLLSFLFYAPVVLWANTNPKIGMFMLPKTCMYIWILVMFL